MTSDILYGPVFLGGPERNRTTDKKKSDPTARLLPAKIQFLLGSGTIT